MKIAPFFLAGTTAMLLFVLGCGGQGTPSQPLQASIPAHGSTQNPTGNSGVPTPPAQAKGFPSLQSADNWQSCNSASCAGGSGAGSDWMAQNQTSPSVSGSSMELSNSGVWGNALWWNKLQGIPSATNFLWDFDFQVDEASLTAGQALEFDMFQFLNGYNYMMGTECNYASGFWDLWDGHKRHWQRTSVPCSKFQPGVWHHIELYAQRSSNSTSYTFLSLTVDEKTYPLDQTYSAADVGWDGYVGVQFQLDVNASGQQYAEWVDNVTFTVW
jgi:hypothetical protein